MPVIALIEDDDLNRRLIMYILKKVQVSIVELATGTAAIEYFRNAENKVDLVLMDIQLPEISGFDLIKEVRTLPHLKDVPVIALTAYAVQDSQRDFIEKGFNNYIGKPIDNAKLFALVKNYLGL